MDFKNSIIIIFLFHSLNSYSQDCNIGNNDTVGFNYSNGNITMNNLLGNKFTLSNPGIVHSLNLIGKEPGALVKMAVYSDSIGYPDSLLIESGSATVSNGVVSIPIPPTFLLSGDYWLMAIYNSDAQHTYRKSNPATQVFYLPMNFNDTIPNDASDFLNYYGRDFTYYMTISCSFTEIESHENILETKIYPNPFNQTFIMESENLIPTKYEITDLTGKIIYTGILKDKLTNVDLSNVANGIYLLRMNETTVKLLKN